ncbi:MAG: peptidoglycan DD-metalloendopeptidase family protein [Acutalibacteraceae bacterium]|jgi:murein DD-endopeptidase MepM/ murein hydrolase activator NlpD
MVSTVSQQGNDIPHSDRPDGAKPAQSLWLRVGSGVYKRAYMTGIFAIRWNRRLRRRFARVLRPVEKANKAALAAMSRTGRTAAAELRRMAGGFPLAGRRIAAAWRQNPLRGLAQVLALPFLAVRRHRVALRRLSNVAAPVLAVAVLAVTVQYWSSRNFALALEVDGQPIGYIQDESVLDAATALAGDRVAESDAMALVQQPRLSIGIADETAVLSQEALCDELLKASGDAIAELYGVYVDGEFEGALTTQADADKALQAVKDAYAVKNGKADFVQTVEIREALYPLASLRTDKTMADYLLEDKTVLSAYTAKADDDWKTVAERFGVSVDQLKADNPGVGEVKENLVLQIATLSPRLQVQVVAEQTHTEEIPFDTVEKTSDELYVGQKQTTGGETGEKTIVESVTFVNGEETARKTVSEKITKKPVTQTVVSGTKTITGVPGDSSGALIWPVPICHNTSRGVSYGHAGLDICNGPVPVYGQPFVAAASGTVVEAAYGWNGGYGNVVKIDHGNGFTTIYAHCSSLSVTPGQTVNAGDLLGLIGNTGASDGPHLHFEVRLNGAVMNPYDYF